jgi:hypothetical protein
MNFRQAIEEAKNGNKIARAGWNGKNMWVCHMPEITIPEGMINGRTKKFVPSGNLQVGGYFVIFTAQGIWQPGWLASQNDMLANDWELV